MTTVRDLTDPYLDTFTPVPPTAEGVCSVCHGAPNPGWATCWSCDKTIGQVVQQRPSRHASACTDRPDGARPGRDL